MYEKENVMNRFVLVLLVILSSTAMVHGQVPYYQGKTVRLIVSSTAGSNYDLYGRLVAQYIGKHIPGKPEVVVQNMPGGGNIVGANYVYSVAKPDGLTFGTVNAALYFNQLGGNKDVAVRLVRNIFTSAARIARKT